MTLLDALVSAWRRTDALFDRLRPEAFYARPLPLRHPFVFYLGHLPAFAWNQLGRGVLDAPSIDAELEALFARGIDPTDTATATEAATTWPAVSRIESFRDAVRSAVRAALPALELIAHREPLAHDGRILHVLLEHELMHHETLLYMVQALGHTSKLGAPQPSPPAQPPVEPRWVRLPAARVTLGVDADEVPFAWDNESPRTLVEVDAFEVRTVPVTIGEYRAFVDAQGYADRGLWSDEAWSWRERTGLVHPASWRREGTRWFVRSAFQDHPIEAALQWPVFVSRAEADAFLRWAGTGRLPTESEWQRVAWHGPDGAPLAATGQFGLTAFEPAPVGRFPNAWGVSDLFGPGWEWTSTPFAGFPGFVANVRTYPGYSADFFDGRHFVLKGASWATDRRLVRPSFRNWFQPHSPWVFAQFRPVRATRERAPQ